MIICTECGEPGASYCPLVSTLGPPEDYFYHPTCYAKKQSIEGGNEYTTLSGTNSFRGTRVLQLPFRQKGSMHTVRISLGGIRKPVQPTLRRL